MYIRRALLFLLTLSGLLLTQAVAQTAAPVLFYTDIDSGPATGGEGLTDGAFVCVYGENFGSVRGSSTVTIGGVEAAQYKLWNDPGAPYQSGMVAKACVQISHLTSDGGQTIQIATSVGASNAIPFTARPGNIWWVSATGDDTNGDGSQPNPWATIARCKNQMAAGDICVIGTSATDNVTVTAMENWEAQIWLNSSGTEGLPKAIVAYPGDTVSISGVSSSGTWASTGQLQGINNYGGGGATCGGTGCSYWTIAGLSQIDGDNGAVSLLGGSNIRLVDNDFVCHGQYCDGPAGGLSGTASILSIYGNRFHDIGCHEDFHYASTAFPCAWVTPAATISTAGFTFMFSSTPSSSSVGSGYSSTVAEGDVIQVQVNGVLELHRILSCSSQCIAGQATGLLDSAVSSSLVRAAFQYRDFVPTKLWHNVYLDARYVDFGWNQVDGSAGKACRGVQFYSETTTGGDGFAMHDLHVHDNWIHDTVCDGINFGSIDPSQGTVEAFNNVIYNAGFGNSTGYNSSNPVGGLSNYTCIYSPGYVIGGAPAGEGALLVYNNTLYNCGSKWNQGGGIGVPMGPATDLFMVASNNIVYAAATGEQYIESGSTSSRFCQGVTPFCPSASLNNVFYGSGSAAPSYLGNNILANPQFKRPTADFHLRAFDFVVNGGTSTLMEPTTDFDGIPRNLSMPTPGAYEYVAPANLSPTTTMLTADVNPQNVNFNVTFTVTVTPSAGYSGSATPSGQVSLYNGWSLVGTATLGSTGQATFRTAVLSLGLHTMRVLYLGDSNFVGSDATLVQTMGKAVVSISASSLTFQSPVNMSSASQQLALKNTGTGPLAIGNITLTGTGASQFTQSANCPLAGTPTLAPGASCSITVTFSPTLAVPASEKAVLNINVAAPGISKAIALTGKVVSPTYTLSATSLAFGNQASGVTGASQTLTITNTSPLADLTITNIIVPWPFVLTNTCGSFPMNLAPQATCPLSVAFTSEGAGSSSGSLQVLVAAPGVSKSVALKGTSVLPIAVTYATGLNYGPVTRGTKDTVALTVTNPTGNPVLTRLAVTFSGSSDFKRYAGTCSTSLSGNASCSINIVFAPLAGETQGSQDAGTITITGTQSPIGQSQSVTLTGIAN